MVACTPLFNGVQGPHRDVLVEAAGGEDIVQLIVACRFRVLTWEVERDNVTGVRGFTCSRRLRLPTIRSLGPHELQPDSRHPLEHGPVSSLPVRVAAIAIAVRDIEITGGQDTVRLWILVPDESR